MSLEARLSALAARAGTEAKALRTLINGNVAGLTNLNTTAQGNLVAAINELKGLADAATAAAAAAAQLNDAATNATETWSSSRITSYIAGEFTSKISDTDTEADLLWSSQKIDTEITTRLNAAIDGAPAALNTLNELSAAIGDDANFAGTMTAALGNRVRYDAAQTLSAPQQGQACANIGVGNPEVDLVAAFEGALA